MSCLAMLLFAGAASRVYAQQAGTIATVDSSVFAAEILEYKQQIDQLNREFEAQTREVQKLALDLRTFEIDLNTNRLNYTEAVRRERAELLERLRKQYQRKSEDLEAAVKKRAELIVTPVKERIMQALKEFVQARGISLLYDVTKAAERGGIVYAAPAIDITAEFIETYNRAHPH